jgi:hypothetical protein
MSANVCYLDVNECAGIQGHYKEESLTHYVSVMDLPFSKIQPVHLLFLGEFRRNVFGGK